MSRAVLPITLLLSFIIYSLPSLAGRFSSGYSCSDTTRVCRDGPATKTVDGFPVYKSCWSYGYIKTCNYPSKNDCYKYAQCYEVAVRDCILRDSYGNCVNSLKEFSCERTELASRDSSKVHYSPDDKNKAKELVCKGVPCVDGNCVDKSYTKNDEMLDSIAKLYVMSEATKGGMALNLFPGAVQQCTKKPTDYSNCCNVSTDKGLINNWGHNIGAKCTADERLLISKRQNNLCVYAAKEKKATAGVLQHVKHKYCCFGNILNKVLQEQVRKQLNISWSTAGGETANCRGLTIHELLQVNFDLIDLSEAYELILRRLKLPSLGDIDSRVKSSMPCMKESSGDHLDREQKQCGFNGNVVKDIVKEDDYAK